MFVEAGSVSFEAEVLFHEIGDERHAEGCGVVGRPAQDGVPDERPEDRDEREEDEGGEDQREEQELHDPRDAAAAGRCPSRSIRR